MNGVESKFRFYSAVHERVFKPRLVTCREDFNDEFVAFLKELDWFEGEVLPTDTSHEPGIGLSAQLNGVILNARTQPQTLSLAVTAIDYCQIENWSNLPQALQTHFPAQRYRIISSDTADRTSRLTL
jgi:hypothetical protein